MLGVFAPSRNGREQRIWEGIPAHSGGGWEGALPPMAPSRNGREQYGQWGGEQVWQRFWGNFDAPSRNGREHGREQYAKKGGSGGGAFLHV